MIDIVDHTDQVHEIFSYPYSLLPTPYSLLPTPYSLKLQNHRLS
ncbi:hypothetical protein [Moorena producens]|nr:hypothetical protein [Moorena producens]